MYRFSDGIALLDYGFDNYYSYLALSAGDSPGKAPVALASSLKPRGRKLRPSTCSAGSASLGPLSIRRAVERPIPVVATTRSRISPLSALDALRY